MASEVRKFTLTVWTLRFFFGGGSPYIFALFTEFSPLFLNYKLFLKRTGRTWLLPHVHEAQLFPPRASCFFVLLEASSERQVF